jgi:hypothetical protein
VLSGNGGSLVTWFRCTPERGTDKLMVYDTAKRRMVVDRLMPTCHTPRVEPEVSCSVDALVGDHVYWTRSVSGRRLLREQLVQYDVSTGRRVPVTRRDLAADLRNNGRSLVVGDSWEAGRVADGIYQQFRVAGSHLVPTGRPTDPGAPTDTSLFDSRTGKRVQLRVTGYENGTEFTLYEWLSDDTVALAVQGGLGGPPPYGDILRCRLSTGECERAVRGRHDPRIFPNLWLPA